MNRILVLANQLIAAYPGIIDFAFQPKRLLQIEGLLLEAVNRILGETFQIVLGHWRTVALAIGIGKREPIGSECG